MKKIILLLLIILIFLCSCAAEDRDFSSVTEVSEESKVFVPYPDDLELKEEESFVYTPDASEKLKAVWISQYDITKAMCSKEGQNPAGDYAAYIDNMCKELKNKGYNALFVQVRPFGDSFYPSEYYPPSKYAVGAYGNSFEYDPIELLVSAARTYGLEFHAWVNPFRLMEEKELSLIPEDSPIRQLHSWGKLSLHGGRYYLRPSDEAACALILNGIEEIIRKYDVDGIHFDDYFYPTTDPAFDSEDFAASGETRLQMWRRNNVSEFVKRVYALVKSLDTECVFGISPAGNMHYTYATCCTDIYKWCSTDGYVDYIMPQIYFGYIHSTAPFSQMVSKWADVIKTPSVKLYIGLAAYKQGATDNNAGDGKNEWITDKALLSKQAEECLVRSDGYNMFSYAYIN
ncbi:MAG: family 10 glycosylhydrolase [Clostridia bacterium]|nr:family 10 glycosylhydrolase [Clostridia bacterium]